MCVRSQFEEVSRLYGDLERDRGQSNSTQSYNGLSSSYLQKRSRTVDWLVGSSCPHGEAKTTSWNEECDRPLMAIKQYLIEPPVLASLKAGDTLYLYLTVSEASISAVLFKEDENRKQRPILFVSKSLSEVETCYTRLKQATLALRVAAKKLRPYFQAHLIVVLTNLPL